MGWLSDIVDFTENLNPFSGDKGDMVNDVLNPLGNFTDAAGITDGDDWHSQVGDWMDDVAEANSVSAQMRFRNARENPLHWSIVGSTPTAAGPSGTKILNKTFGTDFEPFVNEFGNPTNEHMVEAERRGVDTSNARGLHGTAEGIGTAIGNYYTGGLFSLLMSPAQAYGQDQSVSDALQDTGKNYLAGQALSALGGYLNGPQVDMNYGDIDPNFSDATGETLRNTQAPQTWQQQLSSVGQQAQNFNLGETVGVTNPQLQSVINSAGKGAVMGGAQALVTGDSVGEGAGQGAVRAAGKDALGVGMDRLGDFIQERGLMDVPMGETQPNWQQQLMSAWGSLKPEGVSNRDFVSGLGEIGTGAYGLYEAQQLANLGRLTGGQTTARGQLEQLLANPAAIENMPGWKAGQLAVQRQLAAQGYTGSGNAMKALQDYGGDFYNDTLRTLSGLGAPTADQQNYNIGATNLRGKSINRLLYGGSRLFKG